MQLKSDTTLQNGRFKIIRCIGDGGFGITYLASDERLGREVVLKEYFPDYMVKRDTTVSFEVHTLDNKYSDDFHVGIKKFLNEAKLLAQFNHIPAIADVYDFFEENNTAYIVMEYIKGQNLKEHIKARTTPYTFKEMLRFIGPCMYALQRVHEAGIIHRDFAPDNILIDEKGQVKIIDFGASRDFIANNATMTIMVKHGYAPAEQYSNAVKQGPYTDVYSLSAIIYEMLTLQKPMPSVDRMFSDTLKNPIEINSTITPAQNAAIMKGMAVSYVNRYQTVEELSNALNGLENEINEGGTYVTPVQVVDTPQSQVQTNNSMEASNDGQSTELVSNKSIEYPQGQSTELVSNQGYEYGTQQTPYVNASMETEVLPSSQINNTYSASDNNYSQTNNSQYTNQQYASNVSNQAGTTYNYQDNNAQSQNAPEKKKSKKGLIIALSVAAAVVVLGLIGAFAFIGSGKSNSTKTSKTDKTEKVEETEINTVKTEPAKEEEPAPAEEVEEPEVEEIPYDSENGGKVFNIYLWNEEFKSRVVDHYPGYEEIDSTSGMIGDVKVNWIIVPSDDNQYRNRLDDALSAQGTCDADDKVDMFLGEPEYLQTYVDSYYTMSMTDLGIKDSELSDQYDYTHVVGSTPSGEIKAVTWQIYPSAIIYNRQIAKEVLGSDDPDTVQAALTDWNAMMDTTAVIYNNGYKFTATAMDTFRMYNLTNNTGAPLITNNKVTLPDRFLHWADNNRLWIENNLTTDSAQWSNDWSSGFYGNVFCYIGPSWFWKFCMDASSEGSVGYDGGWGICMGPKGFGSYWGGTYMMVAEGCDNQDLAADIIRKLTADSSIMEEMGYYNDEGPNSKKAMAALANNSGMSDPVLGGQNPYGILDSCAKNMSLPVQSSYDYALMDIFYDVSRDYLATGEGYDELEAQFYREVTNKYPHLKHD